MSFSLEIGRWSKKAMHQQDTVRRAVILKLFTSVIKSTPVLTGRLRGSWRCTVGHPDLSVLGKGEKGDPGAAVEAVAAGSAPKDVAVLSNALPYAHRIEYEGWSHTKAPSGMVRKNVARFRQLLAQEVHNVQ